MPHLTVAALIERQGRFLVVEEHTPQGLRINQPAGHLEADESLLDAVVREVAEETGQRFQPRGWTGCYLANLGAATYLRTVFVGTVAEGLPLEPRDVDIVRCFWLSPAELMAMPERWRSPLVGRCLNDWLQWQAQGRSALPLDTLIHIPGAMPRQES
jgi:8-oxo-dGTP pyrophosphatase MutT (NUDIX family)